MQSLNTPVALEQLRALRCLCAVAHQGSAVRAAQVIHLSQPAVTRAIIDLESMWQLPLFKRGSRGMAPTEAGASVAARVDVLLHQLELGATEARALSPASERMAVPQRFASAVSASSLKAFLALAISGSEAQAAQLLGLSQPAVHRAARSVEQLSKATLIQKSPRGSWLTPAGIAMLRRIKLAVAQARAIEADLCIWQGSLKGRVCVGVLPLSASMLVTHAVNALSQKYPDIEIVLVDGTYESLLRQLLSAEIDVVVGALRPGTPPTDVRVEKLFEDDLVLIARRGHPCLEKPINGFAELLSWPWVTPLEGTPASSALARVFQQHHCPPPAARLQANSPSLTRALIVQSDRLAITSREQATNNDAHGMVGIVPLVLPDTTRQIGTATRAIGEPSPDLKAFLEEMRKVATTYQPADTQN